MNRTDTVAAHEVAAEISRLIQTGVKMSLGFHSAAVSSNEPGTGLFLPGYTFLAKIIAFRKDGTRGSSARIMRVTVTLNSNDLYNIDVRYAARRSVVGDTVHFQLDDIYASMLNKFLLALDYDGDAVLNPRIVG
jgi:hypothetical protein